MNKHQLSIFVPFVIAGVVVVSLWATKPPSDITVKVIKVDDQRFESTTILEGKTYYQMNTVFVQATKDGVMRGIFVNSPIPTGKVFFKSFWDRPAMNQIGDEMVINVDEWRGL